ncbi:hypothetical protein F975_02924 [Acinetobacter sp. ANC 3789]|uniref:phage holin family protein n=1 Tax=Acinetobacter sp. ANC 3789 TaxID=1217714 RepID=UPI0002CEB4D7|nr:phage holin family protein [Acinetobacter sp. ANC 3789]ENU79232.1 hypothetical protein F975_02924 [Acinetobacter sp. ANC 3789]
MLEILYSVIAVVLYVLIALRIICFDSNATVHQRLHEMVAFILIAALFGQSINIIFYKDPVTIWDAFFALVLFVIVFRAKGNIAVIFRSKSL